MRFSLFACAQVSHGSDGQQRKLGGLRVHTAHFSVVCRLSYFCGVPRHEVWTQHLPQWDQAGRVTRVKCFLHTGPT